MDNFTPNQAFSISLSKKSSSGKWDNVPMNKLNKADNASIFVDLDDQEQIAEAGRRLDALRAHCKQDDALKTFKGSLRATKVSTKNGEMTRVQLNRRPSMSFQLEDLIGTAVDSASI
jgi:hypothetical protein